jgi:hypothetical protein
MALNHDDTAIERWADPPPRLRPVGRTRDDYTAVIDTLRRRPRTWALVFEQAPRGRAAALKKADPRIEAVTRNEQTVDGKKRCDIYARYMPKDVEAVS